MTPAQTAESQKTSSPLNTNTKNKEVKINPELAKFIPRRTVSRTSFLSERPLAKTVMNMLTNVPQGRQPATVASNQNILAGLKLPLALIADSKLLGPALLSLLGSAAITVNRTRVTGSSKEIGTENETESERQKSALAEPEQVAGVGEINEANTVGGASIR